MWGAKWAFGEPNEKDLDPLLLLWWMRDSVHRDRLPAQQVVVQFDFTGAVSERYWLLLNRDDVSVCLTYPGFEPNVLVTADIATYFQVWLGRCEIDDAIANSTIQIDAIPTLAKAFPDWFSYSLAAPAVRAAQSKNDSHQQLIV